MKQQEKSKISTNVSATTNRKVKLVIVNGAGCDGEGCLGGKVRLQADRRRLDGYRSWEERGGGCWGVEHNARMSVLVMCAVGKTSGTCVVLAG